MCECHDTDEEHEAWWENERDYWEKEFGLVGKTREQRRLQLAVTCSTKAGCICPICNINYSARLDGGPCEECGQ